MRWSSSSSRQAPPSGGGSENESRWVLLDYNDVVVHVQNKEERVFYALERIWKDCPEIALPEAALAANGTQS
jgi:ribosome-associated protein